MLESTWCIGCTRKRAGLEEKPQRKSKAVRHREERFIATAPKQAWSVDFVADQLHDGTHFRGLTMLDVYTREGVAMEAGQSLKGEDVVRVLNRVKQQRGVPKFLSVTTEASSPVSTRLAAY
jgi:putative transposase